MLKSYLHGTQPLRWLLFLLGGLLTFSYSAAASVPRKDAAVLCAEGIQFYRAGDSQRALPLLEEGFAKRDDALFARSVDFGVCALILGILRHQNERYTGAKEGFIVALEVFRVTENGLLEATTLNYLGNLYLSQGRYKKALTHYLQALAIYRDLDHRNGEGVSLTNTGGVYVAQGGYEKAMAHLKQALAIHRDTGNLKGQGITLQSMGVELYRAYERYEEALIYLQQALAVHLEPDDRTMECRTLTYIGGVYRAQGGYEQALLHYFQSLTIMREIENRAGEGTTLNNIGEVYHAQGRCKEALSHYSQALSIVKKVGHRAGEGTALSNIGITYWAQKHYRQALERYVQAMDVFESVRTVAGSEAGRAGFIAKQADLYSRAVASYHRIGQSEKAFLTSERGRARSFLDSLATGQVQLQDNEAADLLARENKAYSAWQTSQDALARAKALDPPDPKIVSELVKQLAETEKNYKSALAAIGARGDQLSALVPGRSTVRDVHSVQALLDEKTTLVSYYVLGEEGTLAFVIGQKSFSAVPLPKATPDALHRALFGLNLWPNLNNPHPMPLKGLHAWLVAPLDDHLLTPQLAIIPHQLLHYVPFAALSDGKTYFGDQHAIFVLPSATSLPFIQANAVKTRAMKGKEALVFGNPATAENLTQLRYAAAEAEAVADFLGVKAYTGAKATEAQLRSSTSEAQVVHLAAHGSYNVGNALYSALYLAPQAQQDGRLEVHEIYGLDLESTDMVVLSACQTNIGELSAGDELVGLTRAFFFAGTPTVVASLWSVDDKATKDLMVAFYRYWQKGLSKAGALQAAQAEVRKKYLSPFYWAAFILSGDPGKRRVK